MTNLAIPTSSNVCHFNRFSPYLLPAYNCCSRVCVQHPSNWNSQSYMRLPFVLLYGITVSSQFVYRWIHESVSHLSGPLSIQRSNKLCVLSGYTAQEKAKSDPPIHGISRTEPMFQNKAARGRVYPRIDNHPEWHSSPMLVVP